MLSKQCCPHTGVVNFYTQADPFVSVGSIMKLGEKKQVYCWRWYDAVQTISGVADDMQTAEVRLLRARRRKNPAEGDGAADIRA